MPGSMVEIGVIELGPISTRYGQPAVGRRVRTETGAHFVLPLDLLLEGQDTVASGVRPGPRDTQSIASVRQGMAATRPKRRRASLRSP